jgi:hypothetical protein
MCRGRVVAIDPPGTNSSRTDPFRSGKRHDALATEEGRGIAVGGKRKILGRFFGDASASTRLIIQTEKSA